MNTRATNHVWNIILDDPDLLGFRLARHASRNASLVDRRRTLSPYCAYASFSTYCVCLPSPPLSLNPFPTNHQFLNRYISDVGAHQLQPLFIAMGTVTVVTFDMVFVAERWLRHRGRLAENTSWFQKGLSIAATLAAIAGAVGLILLTILDDLHHHRAHDACLAIFMYVSPLNFLLFQSQAIRIHKRLSANEELVADTSSPLSSSAGNTNVWGSTTGNTAFFASPSGSSSPSSSLNSHWPSPSAS